MSWQKNACHCCAYQEKMKEISKQIPTEIPNATLEYLRKNRQKLLTDIGGDWLINNIRNTKYPIRSPILSKKQQQEEYKLKVKLKVACDHWKD